MKKAAIYMRVSTDRQAQEGDSIPAQRDALMKYVNSHKDMVFAGEYLDDGISGTKNDREELQRMLSDVEAGRVNLILVTKMDRLHRSLKNFLDMQEVLDRHHCDWLAIWEPAYDSSTPQGRMIINTMMNLAQFEAEQTGQRIRQVFGYKRQKGEVTSGKVPLGYTITDKHLVPDDKAEIVKDIFRFYADTGNLRETTHRISCIHGIPMTTWGVKHMLRNPKYIGLHDGNPEYCPAIIDSALFADVQYRLGRGVRASAKRVYIFSGLLVCGTCGTRIDTCWNKGKRYRCRKHYAPNRTCSNPKTIAESVLESYLLENIKPLLSAHIVNLKAVYRASSDVKGQKEALQHKIDRLKELYVNDMISMDEYRADKEMYLEELKKLDAVKTVDTSKFEKVLTQDIESVYAGLDDSGKKAFWRSIIREIRFGADRSITVSFL